MDIEDLTTKYNSLLLENQKLKEENAMLKKQLKTVDSPPDLFPVAPLKRSGHDTGKTVWYGSINLLSFGYAEESIMRLVSPSIAGELIKSLNK